MLRRQSAGSSGRAFTLVELLVVIGIIAVLLGILLPTIGAANRHARMTQCASNLRQVATACLAHAQDHQGFVPLAGPVVAEPGGSGPLRLAYGLRDTEKRHYSYVTAPGVGFSGSQMVMPLPAALAPYLGIRDVPTHDWFVLDRWMNDNRGVWKMFMCPSTDSFAAARLNSDPNDNTPVGQGLLLAVAIGTTASFGAAWSTNTDYAVNEGVFSYHSNPAYEKRFYRGNTNRISHPARVVLLTDAVRRATVSPGLEWFPDPWITWSPRRAEPTTLADVLTNPAKALDATSFDHKRHKGKLNIVFLDAHVEALRITPGDLARAYILPPD